MQASGASRSRRYLSETTGVDTPARGLKGWGQDIAATAVKGAIAVPGLVGLVDIPTGGAVGKFLQVPGGQFRSRQQRRQVSPLDPATKEVTTPRSNSRCRWCFWTRLPLPCRTPA